MILLIIKVFSFGFEDAGRRDIVIEEDKVTEGQGIKDYESKLEEELSFNTEEAWSDIGFWDMKSRCL